MSPVIFISVISENTPELPPIKPSVQYFTPVATEKELKAERGCYEIAKIKRRRILTEEEVKTIKENAIREKYDANSLQTVYEKILFAKKEKQRLKKKGNSYSCPICKHTCTFTCT